MTPILGTITPALSNLLQRPDNRVVKQRNKRNARWFTFQLLLLDLLMDLQQQRIRNPFFFFFFKAESIRGCIYPGEPLLGIQGHSFPWQTRMATDKYSAGTKLQHKPGGLNRGHLPAETSQECHRRRMSLKTVLGISWTEAGPWSRTGYWSASHGVAPVYPHRPGT